MFTLPLKTKARFRLIFRREYKKTQPLNCYLLLNTIKAEF